MLAVASEGSNAESLDHTEAIVDAGKHVFYDKPAGNDFGRFERIIVKARSSGLFVQLGYMFRCHDGFGRIAKWARSGLLGDIYSIRANMSTHLERHAQEVIASAPGWDLLRPVRPHDRPDRVDTRQAGECDVVPEAGRDGRARVQR